MKFPKREIAVAVILAGISSTFSLPVSSNPSIGFSFLGAVEFCKNGAYLKLLKNLCSPKALAKPNYCRLADVSFFRHFGNREIFVIIFIV